MSNARNFKYSGYYIPEELIMLTGGGTDDWDRISKYHIELYRKYTPVEKNDFILEIGCGVGRDAIQLTNVLSNKGGYVGIDIIKPSIEWCKKNITSKYKNFKFHYYDIKSQIHNSTGKVTTRDIKLPVKDGSVDRIFLHSVFTHMFEDDIQHYLKEFNRVLKDDGLVMASFFVMDSKSLESLAKGKGNGGRHPLSFKYKINNDCYINDRDYPEGAVGYTPKKIRSMLFKANLGTHGRFIHRGQWSGLEGSNGQDILILEKVSKAEALLQYTRPVQFTSR